MVSTVFFAIVLGAGLLERVFAISTPIARQTSDTSIVYLMARHVAHGDVQAFYWGQAYGGTLLQLTAGALFWLFRPSMVLTEGVEIAYWLLASLLLGSVIAKARGRVEGIVAAAAFWLATPLLVKLSLADPGFYGDGLAAGLAAMRVAQGLGTRWAKVEPAVFGVCMGVALWLSPLTLALTMPAAGLFLLRVHRGRSIAEALVGGVVGAAPSLWANAHTAFASLHPYHSTAGVSLPLRYEHVFTELLPAAAGFASGTVVDRVIAAFAAVTLIAGAIAGARRRQPALTALAASGLLAPAVVALSGEWVVATSWRYSTFIIAPVIGLLASAVRTSRYALAAALAVLPIWTTVSLWHQSDAFRPVPHAAFGHDIATLGRYLEGRGDKAVWADYWISYLLSAETREKLVAAAIAPPMFQREKSYERDAMKAQRTTVVVFAGRANDRTLVRDHRLPPYTRTRLGPYAIWVFSRRLNILRYVTKVA